MLQYENIAAWSRAHSRLQHRYRHATSWYTDTNTERQDADKLTLFATDLASKKESQHNLSYLLDVAKKTKAVSVIVKPKIIQLSGYSDAQDLDKIISRAWRDTWWEWWSETNGSYSVPVWQQHEWPDCYVVELQTYGPGYFCRSAEVGVYRAQDGMKITNRREQIELLWSQGLPSRRGRPIHVAPRRWSGSKEELILLTELAGKHRPTARQSEVSAKIVSAFNAINRCVAWPGAW